MGLAEGVSASNEGDGLFIIHCHAAEGLTDIARGCDGIRLAVGAFRIDIDETHLHGAERVPQLTFAAIAFIAQPGTFRTPVELLGLPGIGAAAAEAEGLETHRLERDVAGENEEIGPRDLTAV